MTRSASGSGNIVSRLLAASRWTLLLAIQGVVIFLLLEVVGRVFDPLGISYYPETARYLDTMIIEEPLGYRNQPGLQGTYYSTTVSLNSLGMRDREVAAKAKNEFRVLVMGDSVPFGIGVRYEDSFPHRLEELLNSADSDNDRDPGAWRQYRTLNMGVPSYNTEQELEQLRTVGLGLQPDLAMLLFSNNDIETRMWVFDKRRSWLTDKAQRSYAASLLFRFYREARARLVPATPVTETAAPAGDGVLSLMNAPAVAFGEYRVDRPRWQAIDRSLTEINRLLKDRGIPFVLLVPPDADYIVALLRGVAQREGFPLVLLDPWADPRWAGEDPRNYSNSYIDGHPNAAGHLIYATLIAENLEKLAILPPGAADPPGPARWPEVSAAGILPQDRARTTGFPCFFAKWVPVTIRRSFRR